jgi:beta-ribofuranosylaminobenzene 5'-phosphate synthase
MNSQSPQLQQAIVQTGSRLHFGLIRVGKAQRRYGGLGVIIEEPRLEITARIADEWSCVGPFGDRLLPFVKGFFADRLPHEPSLPGVAFTVESAPPEHCGLGSGTQLTLAAAAAMYALAGSPLPSPRQFALETGRGKRSAIGCHGFYQGGLLFEGGKVEEEPLSELQCRIDFPHEWRFVLIRPISIRGVAGVHEQELFQSAPSQSNDNAACMIQLAREVLIPAAFEADFERFSEALFEYGWRAGESFAFAQGDVFSHPETRLRVEDLRRRGITAVGQTSWGPTVFSLLKSPKAALELQQELETEHLYSNCEIRITAARNEGAKISVTSTQSFISPASKSLR